MNNIYILLLFSFFVALFFLCFLKCILLIRKRYIKSKKKKYILNRIIAAESRKRRCKRCHATCVDTQSFHSEELQQEANIGKVHNVRLEKIVVKNDILEGKGVLNSLNLESLKPKEENDKLQFDAIEKPIIKEVSVELVVNYDVPAEFLLGVENQYPIVKFPMKDTIILPYRKRQIARVGSAEKDFELILNKHFTHDVEILGDTNLLHMNYHRPLEPDIAIVCKVNGFNVFIDVEIDEPYSGVDREPIHYIGCGDEYRDAKVNSLGWIVIRFSEKQVCTEAINCVAFIARILKLICVDFEISTLLLSTKYPTPQNRWTDAEARCFAINNERESYLNHNFGISNSKELQLDDIVQTAEESEIVKKIHS